MIYLQLFYIFFKIGLFSFGGGYAMLPIIYHEVEAFNVIDYHEFFNIVAISQITPGPIAVNVATYVGYAAAGLWGSVWATMGVSLPCMSLVLLVSFFWTKFRESRTTVAVLDGIRPATVGLIASAVILFANTSLVQEAGVDWPAMGIFLVVLLGSLTTKLGAITWTVIGGILGLLFG